MRKLLIVIMSLLSVCRVVAEENMSSEMFAVSNSQEFMRLLWTETATLDDFRKYEKRVRDILVTHPEDKGVADLTLATLLYSSKSKVIVDSPRAFELFKQAYAELPEGTLSYALALNNVGNCYYQKRDGLTQDFDSAYVYFSKAAEIDKRFKVSVARMKEIGIGTDKDLRYALECYVEALKAGGDAYYEAYALRYALENEADDELVKSNHEKTVKGVFESGANNDYVKAKEYFEEAAEKGYLPAIVYLGNYYFIDNDPIKKEKGIELYKKAADEGYIPAMHAYALQYCYWKNWQAGGKYTLFEIKKTYFDYIMPYIENAARHGYALAQQELGECYHYGIGVKRNTENAYLWYGAAARQGCEMRDFLGSTTKQQYEKMAKKVHAKKKAELDKTIDELIANCSISASTLDKGIKVTTVEVKVGEKAEENQHKLTDTITEDSWGY